MCLQVLGQPYSLPCLEAPSCQLNPEAINLNLVFVLVLVTPSSLHRLDLNLLLLVRATLKHLVTARLLLVLVPRLGSLLALI